MTYIMRTEKNERSRIEYKSPRRQQCQNRNWSGDNSRDSSRDSQDRGRRVS